MIDSAEAIEDTATCDVCGSSLLLRNRYALAEGWSLYVVCSESCLRVARRAQRRRLWGARWRRAMRLAVVVTLVAACVTPHEGPARPRRAEAVALEPAPPPQESGAPRLPAGWFGPEWPPTETSLLAALGRDAWVHPLSGPVRRMPRSDSRVFGADRPGHRAIECRNGHCGVDLGGEIWGEHVHAAHDGVIDFVQRGPNEEHGGSFVRLSHRDGTIFTMYFHLAAIPRALERGMRVKGGDVIGLVGDTGVKESPPHLHFSISVRLWKNGPERYMDPEPLIALWPLRVPLDGSEAGLVSTVAAPGMPLGSALKHGRKGKAGRLKGGAGRAAAAAGGEGEGETTPTGETSPDDDARPETATRAPSGGEE
jgi:murein DD-endopeptidase MepM/ murein hydrolase activator NlpD